MFLSRRKALMLGVTALPISAWLGGQVRAQGERQPVVVDLEVPPRDPLLAGRLLIDGQKQIEICEFALTKLVSQAAADFAELEVREHELVRGHLDELGWRAPQPLRTTMTGTRGEVATTQMTVGRMILPPGASDALIIDQAVARRAVRTFREVHRDLRDEAFDRAFLTHQLHEHYGFWDKAQIYRQYADRDLQAILVDALKIIDRHIASLERLVG